MADESKYASEWETWSILPAGAGWAFAVGIIRQSDGKRRVRVAKGKFKAAEGGAFPITQQQKFNLKPADWKALREVIDRYIAQLEAQPSAAASAEEAGAAGGAEEAGAEP